MDNRTIGQRAAELIRQRVKENGSMLMNETDILGVSRKGFYSWESGRYEPQAFYLQQMALNGYDVVYILTGERKDNEKTD